MKKKLLALCLAALTVVAATGATLAYFTDTASADNTFTVGNVKIQLNEQQRGKDGLVAFAQPKKLSPLVGSAQGEKDALGMPTAKNYVDKMVTVTNTGSEDAYIRAYFAIPAALDDGYETFNPGINVLHFNFGNKLVDGKPTTTEGTDWIWKHNGKWNYYETTIANIRYNVYYADYAAIVAAGETTERFVDGVYLDQSFDFNKDGTATAFGKTLALDELWNWNAVTCPVFAVACQAAGFESAGEAITAAFGANYSPWGGTTSNWQ